VSGPVARSEDLARLYAVRFSDAERARKERLWQVLCRGFLQRYVPADATVLDIGAGQCEFVNHIAARRRLALDLSDDVRRFAAPGVEVVQAASTDMRPLDADSVDVAFASNFFEHLPTREALLATLAEVRRVLRRGGRLLVIQPNIRFVGGAYWDFIDHTLPLTERSLVEALEMTGLEPIEVRARFLPFTTKSALPQHPFLVWLYLKVPLAQRLLGRQSWIVAVKR